MSGKNYDLIILGAGPGGYTAAIRAAQLGFKVGLVSNGFLGGTCLNTGCIPSKALLVAADRYNQINSSRMQGINVENSSYNWDKVQKYRERCVVKLRRGVEGLMRKNDIDVISGHGCFTDAETIEADGSKFRAKHFIIATGSKSRDLPSLKIDGKHVLNSTHALSISKLPSSLLIVGAGAIGCEFAHVMSTFGVETIIVEYLDRPLPMEDEDISAEYTQVFKRKKIQLHAGCSVESVEASDSGVISTVRTRDGRDETRIQTDKVLVSVGRAPFTKNCGYETIGLTMDGPFIKVDEYLRTGVGNIRAIGDVIGAPMLAHKASAQGILAVELIAGKDRRPITPELIPHTTYSQPEVGSVGLTESQAREKFGDKIITGRFPFSANSKAVVKGENSGFAKLVATGDDRKIVGAHIVGPGATDLISAACTALTMGATIEDFSHVIQAHPTLSEVWHEAAHDLIDGTLNF